MSTDEKWLGTSTLGTSPTLSHGSLVRLRALDQRASPPSTAPADPQRYVVREELGRGGMGLVAAAEDVDTGRSGRDEDAHRGTRRERR